MFEHLKATLIAWNDSKNERQKLQHAYLVIAVVMTFIAGVVSLFDPNHGHTLVLVALFAVLAFVANGVVWSLLNSAIVVKLASKPPRRSK